MFEDQLDFILRGDEQPASAQLVVEAIQFLIGDPHISPCLHDANFRELFARLDEKLVGTIEHHEPVLCGLHFIIEAEYAEQLRACHPVLLVCNALHRWLGFLSQTTHGAEADEEGGRDSGPV